MADQVTLEQVEALAVQLTPADQRRLAERLLNGAHHQAVTPGRSWSEIRGIMPYPMFGEDAQAWVWRTRRESDEHQERQWRRGPWRWPTRPYEIEICAKP
jgi:hypothetical protein